MTGQIVRVIAVAIVAALVASCSLGRPPDQIEPTANPWSDEVRYQPVGLGFCDRIRWDSVASDLGMTWGEVVPRRNLASGGLSPVACDIESIGSDHLREGATANLAWLALDMFDEPRDTYRTYNGILGSAERLPNPVMESIEGWWDEGWSVESVRSVSGGPAGSVTYYVYHENMYLTLFLHGRGTDRDTGAEFVAGAIAHFHEVARAVIDEARAHLPCESLVDPPTADCG